MKSLFLAAAIGLTALPALAESNKPSADWTGSYSAVAFGSGEYDLSLGNGLVSTKADFRTFGTAGGYLHQTGKSVFGGEVSYTRFSGKDGQKSSSRLWQFRLKGGYAFGSALPYLTAGVARYSESVFGVKLKGTGPSVGVGFEYKVTKHLALGAEHTVNVIEIDDIGQNELKGQATEARLILRF